MTLLPPTRYPPLGKRGMGAGIGWASRFGTEADYVERAHEELSIVVQAGTAEAASNISDIAAVEGNDAIFVGPADLACDLGHTGNINQGSPPSRPQRRSLYCPNCLKRRLCKRCRRGEVRQDGGTRILRREGQAYIRLCLPRQRRLVPDNQGS